MAFQRFAPPLAVFVIAVLAFLPGLQGGFTNWDDNVNITENPLIHRGFRQGLLPLLTAPYEHLYVPATYASWWSLWHAFGENPLPFHILNLILHAATAVLLYSLFLKIFNAPLPALLGAIWWAVHPLHAESIGWITGLKDVLSVFLAVASFRLYAAWRDTPRRAWFLASLMLFLLACLAKPVVVLLPLVLVAYDRLIRRHAWRELTPVLPFVAIGLLMGLTTIAVQSGAQAAPEYATPANRLILFADSGLFYIEKALWPAGLCPVYGRSLDQVLRMPLLVVKIGLAVALLLLALLAGKKYRLAGAIFIAGLLPVSGIIPFGYQMYSTVADRYAALPLAGLALLLVHIINLSRRDQPVGRATRTALCLVVVIWAGMLAAESWGQVKVWRNSIAVWECAVEHNPQPSARVLSNYSSALFAAGRTEDALSVIQIAVAKDPLYPQARYNRARLIHALHRLPEAREDYVAVLKLDPRHLNAWIALSALEAAAGQFPRAEQAARAALEIAPDNIDALLNLGLSLLSQKRPDEALPPLQYAATLSPGDQGVIQALKMAQNPKSPIIAAP